MKLYYDAENAILGRVGSTVCKELLKGHEAVIINADKCIISGDRLKIIADLHWWKDLGGIGLKGPRVSRNPDLLMKRMIRGMLPWNITKGREAYARLRCYVGNGPLKAEELKNVKKLATVKPIKYVVLKDAAKEI